MVEHWLQHVPTRDLISLAVSSQKLLLQICSDSRNLRLVRYGVPSMDAQTQETLSSSSSIHLYTLSRPRSTQQCWLKQEIMMTELYHFTVSNMQLNFNSKLVTEKSLVRILSCWMWRKTKDIVVVEIGILVWKMELKQLHLWLLLQELNGKIEIYKHH